MKMKPPCCLSIDVKLEDLFFRDRMPDAGRVFFDAIGIGSASLDNLAAGATDLGNGWIKILHRCRKLDESGRCSIYESRPQVCRDWQCMDKNCTLCAALCEE